MNCVLCGAKTQLSLCNSHVTQLRDMLTGLPKWIDFLEDAAHGQTRMGSGGRRAREDKHLNGDDDLLTDCTCGHPAADHEDDECITVIEHKPLTYCACDGYVADVDKLRARLLRLGGINARASSLLLAVGNSLTTTIRDLCEQRGIRLVHPRFIGPLRPGDLRAPWRGSANYARWLAGHVNTIAAGEGAGETYREIERYVAEIERAINKPIPMRPLGRCPTWNEVTRTTCGKELKAREDVIEVYCRNCRATHNCNWLLQLMQKEADRTKMTIDEIIAHNKYLPEEYRINPRTLRQWRQQGNIPKLTPKGYRRPDGRVGLTRHGDDDEPLYLYADLRKVWADRADKGKARAS